MGCVVQGMGCVEPQEEVGSQPLNKKGKIRRGVLQKKENAQRNISLLCRSNYKKEERKMQRRASRIVVEEQKECNISNCCC